MSSQNLWVQHTTARKSLIDLVPIEGCTYIAQLKVTIRNNPELDIPPASKITLYQPDGKTEIDIGDSPTDYLDGNSRRNPLIVKTTAIAKKKKKKIINKIKLYSTQVQPNALFLPCEIHFYNTIGNATEQDTWLLFKKDIPSTSLNKLFIRESYQTIASSIHPGINKAIIMGTPGIG
ncbi:hypothetical protein HMI54_010830, partial [Coelomomyces lativittatus]